ncbi:hypothetical protein [Wolbachia endosymbiont of Oedothorax gibbosus]|uniref:hypothetical protein n=1 Tax=Wolbachia endosymbiont of Oedothorax gibbosus TaxID=931100 RepID=UPI0020258D54|nr:hypothetical protein [Wolbachia endosymbiont of Oedothorax gibbosus]
MPILEQVECVSKEKLEQLGSSEETGKLQSSTLIKECIDDHMRQNISAISHKISQAHGSYNDAEELPISEAVANVASEWLESIKNAKEKKVILSVPLHPGRGAAIMDSLIYRVNHLTRNDDNVKGDDKRKLDPIWSEIYDLISKGNYVSKEMLKLLPEDIIKKREDYLSNLKKIVSESVDNGEKDKVIVERDNAFYCVQCPEKSIITPAKFMNSPEFKDLEYGALRMGEGDNIIRLHNGQYCDMKGRVKMTFNVDGEKLEMTLFSGKAHEPESNVLHFGTIMVHMDDKNCEIFSKYLEELEKEPRVSKVVEAAKSFVQSKTVSPPLSSMSDTNTSSHLEDTCKSAKRSVKKY